MRDIYIKRHNHDPLDVWIVLLRHELEIGQLMSAISQISTDFDSYKASVDKAVQDLVDEVESVKDGVEDPAQVQALEDKIAAAKAAVEASDPGAVTTTTTTTGGAQVDPSAAGGDPAAAAPAQGDTAPAADAPADGDAPAS